MLKIHINNPDAPKPNKPITPGACAVILNKEQKVLLHKREDMKNLWSLPGGKMEPGESISGCCVREIREEMALKIKPIRLIGIYSSPNCIFEWSSELVYQSFVVAFLCESDSSNVVLNNESDDSGWFDRNDVKNLNTIPFVKEIVEKAFSDEKVAFFD